MSDNILNTPGLMDPSTEFGNIMKHAMGIKSHQMEQDRKKFETWPTFLQNSMWERNEETLRLRQLPVAERLDGAQALKTKGNEHFKKNKFASAIEFYEAAVGTFRYAKQLDPDWKNKGIKDETIDLLDERGDEGSAMRAEIDAFCVSVYNNLAASFLARAVSGRPAPGLTVEGDFKLCVQASTFGIELEPTPKALYRRARGLCEPMTATDSDVDMAMRDLAEAAALAPEDKAVRALLAKLKRGRAEEKARAKGAMSGVFTKTELYDKKTMDAMASREASEKKANDPEHGKVRTAEDAEKEIIEAEAAVAHLRERGRHDDAKSLEAKIATHRQQLGEYKQAMAQQEEERKRHDPRLINFDAPTAEQIADAKKHGIDLSDPLVKAELKKLQQEKELNGESDDDDELADGAAGSGGGGKDDVPLVYRGKMNSRLQRMREMGPDGDELGRAGGAADGENARGDALPPDGLKPRTRTIIMAAAFAIALYRIWAMLWASPLAARGDAGGEDPFG